MNFKFQFFRFSLVGGLCIILNLGLFYLLIDIYQWHYLLATVDAFFIINGIGFLLNKNFTFQQGFTAFFPELIRYYIGMAVSFSANILLMAFLVSVLHIHYFIASFTISLLLVFFNFILHRGWTFGLSLHKKSN